MKSYVLTLVFSIIVIITTLALWVLDFIDQAQALNIGGKVLIIVLLLGIGSVLLTKVLGLATPNAPKNSDPNQQGPKF
jgi:hypothetical protein